jgi:predicted TIM-barrel fold metal-dependent hydrolase
MVTDCHVHATGKETAAEILKGMDAAGIDRIVLLAPAPGGPRGFSFDFVTRTARENCDWIAGVAKEAPDRIIPFAWLEPNDPDAVADADYAISTARLKGFKMIPNHWYCTDDACQPTFARIEELGAPILFHSGIIFANKDGSRYCQPVYFEALINYPKLRFAMAHIGWPWVDEYLAVFGRFRSNARAMNTPMQMWIDTCPGTPPIWRPEALQKALAYAGDDRLIWGSDCTAYNFPYAAEVMANDKRILHSLLGVGAESEKKWMGENIRGFLGE